MRHQRATPQRLPSAIGTAVEQRDSHLIDVRRPDGRLVYRILESRVHVLIDYHLGEEVRSPSGSLRFVQLYRSTREHVREMIWHPELSDGFNVMQGRRIPT